MRSGRGFALGTSTDASDPQREGRCEGDVFHPSGIQEGMHMSVTATPAPVVLEPASQAFVEATGKPPFLYQLTPAEARKVLDDVQAAPVDKLPVKDRWVSRHDRPLRRHHPRLHDAQPAQPHPRHPSRHRPGNLHLPRRVLRHLTQTAAPQGWRLAVSMTAGLRIHSRHAWRKDEHPDWR
jgi:hypothetical protein